MADSQATTVSGTTSVEVTETRPSPANIEDDTPAQRPRLDLKSFPKFFVLPTHLHDDEVHELEDSLAAANASITHNVAEARLILSAVGTLRRAKYELQVRGLPTKPVESSAQKSTVTKRGDEKGSPPSKRQNTGGRENSLVEQVDSTLYQVIGKDWLRQSIDRGRAVSTQEFLVYEGTTVSVPKNNKPSSRHADVKPDKDLDQGSGYTLPNRTDRPDLSQLFAKSRPIREGRRDRNADAVAKELAGRGFMPSGLSASASTRRRLLSRNTSEEENTSLPEMPDWVKQNKLYACERSAPATSPNAVFIDQMKKIRLARTLIGDEIGVRAYSTSIASVSSYPYEFISAREVVALPGCNEKIATLFQEYQDYGRLGAADEVDTDPVLSVIHDFYKIWGVGAATAREFYHDRGWRDHDDIIEHGWNTLSRHQQIGLKFFEDFELKMSRSEVELIASVVTYHAKQLVDDGIQCAIVGGYRRGNKECSDVDLIISHPEEEATRFLVGSLIRALEEAGCITHTLTLSETTSNRGQDALPLKGPARTGGFDTLDKALVVWQDPNWTTREADLERDAKAKNPNIHRRVDIIISPWKTVGCAVMGWTSGTTFQRDLRRYSRRVKNWKFDSSGVRDLGSGRWVDLEGWRDVKTRAKTYEEAERRVFDGLGLPWRAPDERNTG